MNQIKDFFEYIFNAIKIWVIVQPWQSGIRVRNGKHIKKLENGIYFKIPYFDSVYVQETRLRVVQFPVMTVTSADLKTITLNLSIGYSIEDIEKLYATLYHPELTIQNIGMAETSDFVYRNNVPDLTPEKVSQAVAKKLQEGDYGLNIEYAQVTNFAVVRTYRLIQDQTWFNEGIKLDVKK